MQHRDSEGRILSSGGQEVAQHFQDEQNRSRESFVSPCLATRKTSEILCFQEGKKRLKEWQEDGRDKW